MTSQFPSSFLPLREPTFYILLSLVPEEKHGYAILKDVKTLSSGRLRLSTGTLYEALSRLLEQGLIERVETVEKGLALDFAKAKAGQGTAPGKPRKVYRLSCTGRSVIEAEAARLQILAAAARRQLGDQWMGSALFV